MPRLTQKLRANLLDDVMNGIKRQDIESKYNISKQSYYALIKKQPKENAINKDLDNQLDPTNKQKAGFTQK